ncbi:MAG: RNA polymerase sigma factor, partial [Sciscionella sp.]
MAESRTAEQAFAAHVLPEIDLLYRVARSITGQQADAEDLVQDTLLRAYRAIGSFDGKHPRAWLLTILRNTERNRHRRQRPGL